MIRQAADGKVSGMGCIVDEFLGSPGFVEREAIYELTRHVSSGPLRTRRLSGNGPGRIVPDSLFISLFILLL